MINHLHIKTHGTACNRLANASHPENTQSLAMYIRAQQGLQTGPLPMTGMQPLMRFGHPPCGCQQQGPGKVGGRFVQHLRSIGDHNAQRLAGRYINIVKPHRHGANNFKVRRVLQHLGRDPAAHRSDHGRGALQSLDQIGLTQCELILIGIYVKKAGQLFKCFRKCLAGHQ